MNASHIAIILLGASAAVQSVALVFCGKAIRRLREDLWVTQQTSIRKDARSIDVAHARIRHLRKFVLAMEKDVLALVAESRSLRQTPGELQNGVSYPVDHSQVLTASDGTHLPERAA